MAYNVAFTIASLNVPGSIVLTDTSTGSDPNLVSRSISLTLADGTLYGGAPINFPYGEGSIKSLTISTDLSINITLTAVSSSPLPSPSSYTSTALYTFTGFSYQFEDSLIGALASNYTIVQDTNYMTNLGAVQTNIDCAVRAGATGQQAAAQAALSRVQYYINNQQLFF